MASPLPAFMYPFSQTCSASTLSFKRGGENKFTLKCHLYLTGIGCLEICVKKDSEAVLKLTGKEVYDQLAVFATDSAGKRWRGRAAGRGKHCHK